MQTLSPGEIAEYNGIKTAALANAIRDRLRLLTDDLTPTSPPAALAKIRIEMIALLDQFPNLAETPR